MTHTCQHELGSPRFKRRSNRALSLLGVLEVVGWTCAAAGAAGLWVWPDTLDSIVPPPTLVRNHSARGVSTSTKEASPKVATLPPSGLGHPATAGVVPDSKSTPAVDVLETSSHSPAPAVTLPEPTITHLLLIDDDTRSVGQVKLDSAVEAVPEEIQEASASTEQGDLDSWMVRHLDSLREEAPRGFPFVGENAGEVPQESASLEKDSLVARGEQLLLRGDLASARLFFRRAADAGDIRGAAGMARSFDQETLRSVPVFGARPDPGQAAIWHTRANELGRVVAGR